MVDSVDYQNIANFTHRHSLYKARDTAAVIGNERLNWKQFDERLCRVAGGLLSLGVRKGDKVASVLGNGWPILELYWALPKIGAVFVPLSPLLTQSTIDNSLRASDCKLAVVDDGKIADVLTKQIQRQIPTLTHVLTARHPSASSSGQPATTYEKLTQSAAPLPHTQRAVVRGGDPCHIFFSSGTTGNPKGIILSHATRLAYAYVHGFHYRMRHPDTVVLHGGSMVFNGCCITMIPGYYHGAKFVMMKQYDPAEYMDLVEKEGVTHSVLVPTQIVGLITCPQFNPSKLKTLRCVITVGAPLALHHKQKFCELLPGILFECYGTTEGSHAIMEPEYLKTKMGSVGTPAACQEIKIVDDAGKELPQGKHGEIVGRGPINFSGCVT